MALHDMVLGIFRKESKNLDALQPVPGSRSEREARIKDKAGLVINVFALLLAVNTWYGGKLSSTIMNNTIAANNQWAWYQAKNVRGVIYETSSITITDTKLKEKLANERERMEADKKEIAEKAKKLEAERDEAKLRSPWIGYANTAYQLAIVLLSASILAVSMPLFWGSFVVAGVGVLLSSHGLWLWI
jgi:ABC-type multidrug transport system fused ATPase/permease subunit